MVRKLQSRNHGEKGHNRCYYLAVSGEVFSCANEARRRRWRYRIIYPKEQINKYARKDEGEKRAEVKGDRGDKFNIKVNHPSTFNDKVDGLIPSTTSTNFWSSRFYVEIVLCTLACSLANLH